MILHIESIGNGRREIQFAIDSRFKIVVLVAVHAIELLTVCRETYWRRKHEIIRERKIESNEVIYQGYSRFIIGAFFGKHHNSSRAEDIECHTFKL